MMPVMRVPLLLCLPLLLAGCGVAKAVITAPIAVGEAVYDASTESEEEADIKRGRALRKAEERAEAERKQAEKARRREAEKAAPK
jgi:hypothetical protein